MSTENRQNSLPETIRKRSVLMRIASCLSVVTVTLLLVAALSGCACRPGHIGPYGGVHPGRCWFG